MSDIAGQMMLRALLLLLTAITCLWRVEVASALESPSPEFSLIDLSKESFDDHRFYTIKENWEVYWGEYIFPEQFASSEPASHKLTPYLNISLTTPFLTTPTTPALFATFRIKFRLPDHKAPFALFVPEIRGASRAWLNGVEVFNNGVLAKKAEDEHVHLALHTLNIDPGVNSIELIIQNSAFSFLKLGPVSPLQIGPRLNIDYYQWQAKLRDVFILSAILIMVFYHFALYFVRGKGIEPVIFGSFCLSMSILTLFRSEGFLIFSLVKTIHSNLFYRMEMLTFPSSAVLLAFYAQRLYPAQIPKRAAQTVLIFSGLFAIISIACSLRAIEYWLIPFQIFILIMGIFYLVYLIQAVLQKVDGSLLFISGFFFILLGAVNDVLKNNDLIDSPPASHIALFGFILFQSILLAKIFSKDFNQLELAEGHIRQLNSNLEQKILDRTHTIRMILDHVQSGFLLINRQLKIETGYTRSCEEILGKKLEVDQKFSDIFSFSDRQRRSFELTINQVFDDILPEDITFAQIKSRLPIKNRQVLLQWAIIRDERNEIKSLLVTVTDSTHAALMEKEAKIGQSLIKILQSKLNFKSLLNEIFNDLNRAKSSDLHIEAAQKSLKMILHTIKGNLSSFGLDDIIHFIEELEDSSFITMIDIESLTFIIHQFLDSYKDILKIEATSLDAKSYQLHERQLLVLNESLKAKGASAEILDTFSDWLDDIRQVSFDDLIGPICKKAQLIGESIGKNVKMTIEGGHISIEPDRYQALVHNLIHLVRNSIDHGLEFPEERGKKPEFGQITMKISRTENAFCIDTCDDGRGIDPEHLKDTALKKGLVSIDDAKIMPASEALSLIFRNGFSTRSEVTSLSGRGIGMSAIESAVIELGGNISIQTQIGIGTIVHIEIPENIDLRNRLKSA